jgi:hypothetical protein
MPFPCNSTAVTDVGEVALAERPADALAAHRGHAVAARGDLKRGRVDRFEVERLQTLAVSIGVLGVRECRAPGGVEVADQEVVQVVADDVVEPRRGRPKEGLYQRLRRAGLVDLAGHGAALVATHRRDHGNRDWALRILRKAWAEGCRTPRLAELLASMTVTDVTPYERRNRQHIHNAITVLDTALGQDAAALGRYVYRLNRRRGWLAARLASPVRVAPAGTRNTRSPAATTLGSTPSV